MVERHKETLKAIAFILLVLGTVAFVEWVILKDYEPITAPGWSGGRLGE